MVIPASGWMRIGGDPAIAAWSDAALPLANAAVASGEGGWRCGGTWFPGVDALPNDARGAVAGVELPETLLRHLPFRARNWHRAQLSTLRPGYPQPSTEESGAAFRYRLTRDAAHVDGLLPIGPDRRRMLKEPHGFILGLPLTNADPEAAPLVVWEGSHEIMRKALGAVLEPRSPADWPNVDLTDAYHAARRMAFADCRRVMLSAVPGEALLLHRLLLHGMAPWTEGAAAAPGGRMIAYFRPEVADITDWIGLP
ncbi:MAG: hypothetical protein DI533_03985 [Cereibacter sphaeroides]|uniref:Phytanoyl-CoA dioxygenase n=1 Tax=Cereibacter sphaeroides TaxID=1063 RepID=A0A2W5U907_CERSP|nr:MAG: hypothetical protein DI533_03985 [Cereibacter sphaeroides]